MADTVRSIEDLVALAPDNVRGQITPQVLRDIVVSAYNRLDEEFEFTDVEVTGTLTAADVEVAGTVTVSGLPTADPEVAGQVWSDAGTLKVSAG